MERISGGFMSVYLEKEKMIEWLKMKESYYLSCGKEEDNFVKAIEYFARAASYTETINLVNLFFFDWQPND